MTLSELKKFIQAQTAQLEGNTEFEHADPLLKRIITECQETNIPLWLWNLPLDEHLKAAAGNKPQLLHDLQDRIPAKKRKRIPILSISKSMVRLYYFGHEGNTRTGTVAPRTQTAAPSGESDWNRRDRVVSPLHCMEIDNRSVMEAWAGLHRNRPQA